MDPHVVLEAGRVSTGIGAEVTVVRLFPSVNAAVPGDLLPIFWCYRHSQYTCKAGYLHVPLHGDQAPTDGDMQSHKRGSKERAGQHPHLRGLLKTPRAVPGSASPGILAPGRQSCRAGSGG